MPVASESRELLDNRPSCLSSPISAVDFAMLRTDSIVITGMGALTCAGPSVEDLWQAALASAVQVNRGPLGLEHTTCGIAQIPQTADTQRLTRKGDRFLPLALHAANAAWQDAGLTKVDMVPERCGLIAGTSRGPINRVVALAETHRHRRPRLSSALHSIHSCLSGTLAIHFHIRGPAITLSAACTSGAVALGMAAEQLLLGKADFMLAGAAEAPLTAFVLHQMAAAGFLGHHDEHPERACRPFDSTRNGTVVGEGAGFMVLERASSALARGANIHATLSGWSFASEAEHRATPNPQGEGLQHVTREALLRAGLAASDIAWINAHGTGTHANDLAETQALKGLGMDGIPCSSTKPVTGHCLGATAALEAILAVQAVKTGQLPPTATLRDPDPACALTLVQGGPRYSKCDHALSLSQAFWGKTAALVLSKHDPNTIARIHS
jgi:3-oxoacyl-[acyl-carrier-protein] synthase II